MCCVDVEDEPIPIQETNDFLSSSVLLKEPTPHSNEAKRDE
jgi:hypothetical protein